MTTRKADSLRVKFSDSLYVDTLLVKPVNYDWYDNLEGERYEVIQPFNEEDFKDEDEYYSEVDTNQPMMNYYYPLPERDKFDEESAKKIQHLNLCLVYFNEDERYALALTGGGMDFSWDICEAYIRLGYYPPIHFRLPNMAGMRKDRRHLNIIKICVKGRQIVKRWMSNDIKDLNHVKDSLVKH